MEELLVSAVVSFFVRHFGVTGSIAFVVAMTLVTMILYVLAMHLKAIRDEGRARWYHYALAAPILVVGYPLDVAFNVIVGSLIFRELPREFLFTSRVDRHARAGNRFAQWVCRHLLNPWDDGHCYSGE
jgi:hypothetical protein